MISFFYSLATPENISIISCVNMKYNNKTMKIKAIKIMTHVREKNGLLFE